jgi:hypothetical protein
LRSPPRLTRAVQADGKAGERGENDWSRKDAGGVRVSAGGSPFVPARWDRHLKRGGGLAERLTH